MSRQPTGLADAFQMCIEFARVKHRFSMERIADRMGQAHVHSLYKWCAHGNMPASLIRPFELACKCTFVTSYLAASTGDHVLIKVPTGRIAGPSDIALLQEACTAACSAVLHFNRGKGGNDPSGAIAAINSALARLAHERGHIQNHQQPEFNFNEA